MEETSRASNTIPIYDKEQIRGIRAACKVQCCDSWLACGFVGVPVAVVRGGSVDPTCSDIRRVFRSVVRFWTLVPLWFDLV
jgi:hypothetical protein